MLTRTILTSSLRRRQRAADLAQCGRRMTLSIIKSRRCCRRLEHTVGILRGGDEQLLEGAPAAAAAAASSSSSSGARRGAASKLDSSSATSSSNSSTSSLTAARPQTPKSPARREGEELALRLRDACGIAVVRAMRNISRFIVQKQFSYWAQTVSHTQQQQHGSSPTPLTPSQQQQLCPTQLTPSPPSSYIYRSDCCRATAI